MNGEEESYAIAHIMDMNMEDQNDPNPDCSVSKMQCFGDKILKSVEISFGHYSLNKNI